MKETKTLGVLVDENITWKNHIEAIESLKRLYKALVLPHFDYCSLVWDNFSNNLKDRLQKLQNKAGRIITGDNYDMSATNARLKLGWKDLQSRRDKQLLSFVQKIVIAGRLNHLFSIAKRDCYQLRSNDNMLLLPKPNTNAMKESFGYRAAVTWNAQPLEDRIYGL